MSPGPRKVANPRKPPTPWSTSPGLLDIRPHPEAWCDLTAWGPTIKAYADAMGRRCSGRHLIGHQEPDADFKGIALEYAHHLIDHDRPPPLTNPGTPDGKVDCLECRINAKATGPWHNPWLLIPENQAPSPAYHLGAVDGEPWLRDRTKGRLLVLPLWTATAGEVMAAAAETVRRCELAGIDVDRFRRWYPNAKPDAPRHHCVHWAAFLDRLLPPPPRTVKPPEHYIAEVAAGRDQAIAAMRSMTAPGQHRGGHR